MGLKITRGVNSQTKVKIELKTKLFSGEGVGVPTPSRKGFYKGISTRGLSPPAQVLTGTRAEPLSITDKYIIPNFLPKIPSTSALSTHVKNLVKH